MNKSAVLGTKTKFQLFSTRTGEEVTGFIINANTAKVVFDDKTHELLYLSYTGEVKDDEDVMPLAENGEQAYRFTVMNFIHEGFVPFGHLNITNKPNPTPALIETINVVLAQSSHKYEWSAKDKIEIFTTPVMKNQEGIWKKVPLITVLVNGKAYGTI